MADAMVRTYISCDLGVMMNRRVVLTILLLLFITFAGAQEFWLQSTRFLYRPGEKFMVRFNEGKNFIGEPWNVSKSRIQSLLLHRLSSSVNLIDSIKEGQKDNLSYTLKGAGTYLLSMQRDDILDDMGADEFNAYLKESGLDEILDQRQRTNTLGAPAKEYRSNHTKLLIQSGDEKDDTYKKVVAFPVEIVPDRNPYALKIRDPIRFKILFDGKPVFGVRVKVWNRYDNRTTIQNIYTEKDGTFEARISNPGPWMVTVVRMVTSKQADVQWRSYHGSLVFGIEK